MLGVYSVAVFFASVISGRLGGLYERLQPATFWLLHAAIVGGGGIAVLVLARPLRYLLAGSPTHAVR